MKITQEKLPASQIGLEIEISPETTKNTYERVITEFTKSANISGFRRGKIPRPILIQRLGAKRIKAAALEELIQDCLQDAIKQESIQVLGNYQLKSNFDELLEKYEPGQSLTFQAAVDVSPEVSLGQYQGLTVKAEEVPYNPQEVEDLLEERRNRLATLVPIENRPAEMGNVAVIDFEGRKPASEGQEGELIPGAAGKDFQLELAEGKFITGFVEGIVGMNLDEKKELHLTFPADYPQRELANQPAIFTIILKELKEKELPELDDDFAQEVSEFETMAELRQSLENQYKEKAANETKKNIHYAISEEILNHTNVDLPTSMIEDEVQNLLVQTANQFQNYGMDISKIFTRETVPEMREKTRPEAIKNLQKILILEEIAKKESIIVDPDTLKEKINQVKESLKEKDVDMAKLEKIVKEELIVENTLNWLADKTTVELVPQGSLSEAEEETNEE